jgi:poly-gamma-glutamate synthase PgsB/CapB
MLMLAHRLRCDAVVLECMSVAPALQELESRLMCPTVSVLTNIREDHREEYGSSPEGLIEGLCAFIPRNGLLISGEIAHEHAARVHAERQGTRVLHPTPADVEAAALLPAEAHRENAALALAVCRELGIPEATALAGIAESARASERELISLPIGEGVINFLNGFAVNDVPSARKFLDRWAARLGGWTSLTILLNTRTDRPYRSIQFARWCATLPDLHCTVLLGSHAVRARRELLLAGMDGTRVTIWTRREIADLHRHLAALQTGPRGVIVGLGNIAGDGFRILKGLGL